MKKYDCIRLLTENVDTIRQKFGVTGMLLFGSVARGDNKADSDVDILVDMPPRIFIMTALKDFLEHLLGVSVDLIRRHSHLSSTFLNQVSHDAVKIF